MTLTAVVAAVLTSQYAAVLFFLWACYVVVSAGENVSSFHPLRKFPGPKFAAMSFLYEFWWDVVKGGVYVNEIRRLHGVYGPVIRINPEELHCSDPRFIGELIAAGVKQPVKPLYQPRSLADPATPSGTAKADHGLHRQIPWPAASFYSKAQISILESEFRRLVQKVCDKLLTQKKSAKPFDLSITYSRLALELASGRGFDSSMESFQAKTSKEYVGTGAYAFVNSACAFGYMPWLITAISKYLPEGTAALSSSMHGGTANGLRKRDSTIDPEFPDGRQTAYVSAFDANRPPKDQTARLAVGTQTTSDILSAITLHLLPNIEVWKRLTEELRTIVGDQRSIPSWSSLEQLPYLSAIILEGQRLSFGASTRTMRIVTEENLRYHGTWTPRGSRPPVQLSCPIPIGSAVSMSASIMHHNEDVFPDSRRFIPERWLDEQGQRRRDLERCLFPISEGSRQYSTASIDYCELYLALTALVLRVYPNIKLKETTIDGVQYEHGSAGPTSRRGPSSVMVQIT